MRVLYCSDTYPPQVNGVSIVTALSVQGLMRLGWECAVVAPRYPAATHAAWGDQDGMQQPPSQVLSLPSIALPYYPEVRVALPWWPAVFGLVKRFRPHLIHCATEFSIGRLGQLAAARAGVPLVSSYHTDFGRYTEAYGAGWLRMGVSAYLSRFHRRSRRVYTPSSVSREDLLRLDVRDVEVWGRGVDTRLFTPARRSQAKRAALDIGDRFAFLYVGRMAAEKGAEQIVEAYRLATERMPAGSIHLVIAGTGPREAALRASAPPGVTFLGFLDRTNRLPDLYANADAFVFASVTETLGLVILEAMASGLPVLAAPAGGVRDHLRDDQNGIGYPPGDVEALAQAMVRIAGNSELTLRLGQGARLTAERLTWELELERLDRSYREVIEAGLAQAVGWGNQQVTVVPTPR